MSRGGDVLRRLPPCFGRNYTVLFKARSKPPLPPPPHLCRQPSSLMRWAAAAARAAARHTAARRTAAAADAMAAAAAASSGRSALWASCSGSTSSRTRAASGEGGKGWAGLGWVATGRLCASWGLCMQHVAREPGASEAARSCTRMELFHPFMHTCIVLTTGLLLTCLPSPAGMPRR